MHWWHCGASICIVGGHFSGTLEGGWMGDNLELFGKVLGFFLVNLFIYKYYSHNHS
jgi:hypothetical protein